MFKAIYAVLLLLCLCVPSIAAADTSAPKDQRALAGITTGKAIFDIGTSSTEAMQLYLKVIKKTVVSLKAQGVTPDFILAFRGAAVSIVSKDSEFNNDADTAAIATLIKELKQENVSFEACHIAAGLFDVDEENLFDGIVVVGNTFVSLIGYQSKGYALIPLM